MSVALAIIGFILASKKTYSLAITYCVLGLLTYSLAFIVGSLQISSYFYITNDICFTSYALLAYYLGKNYYVLFGGIILLAAGICVFISWAGSIIYINNSDSNSVHPVTF